MPNRLKIVVACGSGVATSTLAARAVQDACDENGLNISIETCGIREIDQYTENADIILTTCKYDRPLPCPVMSVTSFVTGVGTEKTKKQLVERLQEILNEK